MSIDAKTTFEQKFAGLANHFSLKPFQEKVVNHVVGNGSTVAVMPTGGGKSLIYWVAAQALGGVCLVVSPLIALIDEQAEKLTNEGFKVLAIHGGMGASEQMKELKSFATGTSTPDFIFVSPERMATDGFFEYCMAVRKSQFKLLVIDEIHCVSQWGFDFRPFYKRIPVFLNSVFGSSWPTVLGLTATINPKELQDICTDFRIPKMSILKDEVPLRFDIDLKVEKYINEEEKEGRLWEIIEQHPEEKILVYLYRKYYKRGVEDLAGSAAQRGISAIAFHGDMSGNERQEVIKAYKNNDIKVVFATNAFGMGIDIPDIRVVVHFMLPESIEQYYQEVGRAGRNGKGATAYVLYSNKNIQVRKTHFIDKSFPSSDEIKELFTKTANNEVGRKTLQYFEEEKLQTALPYFLNCCAITIEGKGFTQTKVFSAISNPVLQKIVDASRTGMVIPVMNRPEFATYSCKEFFNIVYECLVNGKATLAKNLDKCLIIKATEAELTDKQVKNIETEAAEKRAYKHGLLDYLVYLLDNYDDTATLAQSNNYDKSVALHQEIGRYLGVDKHKLKRIHQTESGIWVRSKSEIIIANMLKHAGLEFEYEKKLQYQNGKWKEPDFTITYNDTTWYWEHLGLLGEENYNQDWAEKKEIYKNLGILDRVITTKESSVLSAIVSDKIKKIKEKANVVV